MGKKGTNEKEDEPSRGEIGRFGTLMEVRKQASEGYAMHRDSVRGIRMMTMTPVSRALLFLPTVSVLPVPRGYLQRNTIFWPAMLKYRLWRVRRICVSAFLKIKSLPTRLTRG